MNRKERKGRKEDSQIVSTNYSFPICVLCALCVFVVLPGFRFLSLVVKKGVRI